MAGYSSRRNKDTAVRPKAPDDFDDAQTFLAHIRDTYADDIDYDDANRKAAEEDFKFFVGDQWESGAKERRDRRKKPVLTINTLPAFAGQLIGNRRLNEVQIKVLPDNGGTRDAATVREGLIRNIQKVSHAERVYDQTFENQLIGGIGNFCVGLEYAADDVFEQDICFKPVNDAMAVVWDRKLTDPTGKDAGHVFVTESMTKADFEKRWPWAVKADFDTESKLIAGAWFQGDDIMVANYWRMRTKTRTLAMMAADGAVKDVTDLPEEEWLPLVAVNPGTGSPIVREADRHYAELYVVSGHELLEGPYQLPIKRVPVFRVPGWEVHVGSEKHRWGLVRFLKDPIRLHNFWRSTIAERLLQSPRAKWMIGSVAGQGYLDKFREAAQSDDPVLVYNDEAANKPELIQPAQIEMGLVNEAITSKQDVRDVSNIHEAALGQTSNEVSGRGIVARQRVSELGTVLFTDNLNEAIAEAGAVVNDLIPVAYDTARIIRVLGEDDAAELVPINGAMPGATDITSGKYSVTITTGPSTLTKRIESAEAMLGFINAAPEMASMAMDLIVEGQDWPGAKKLAERFRKALPPGMLAEKDMSEEMKQAAAAAAQKQQEQEEIAKATAISTIEKARAEAEEAQAGAIKAKAEAFKAVLDAESREKDVESKDRERRFNANMAAIDAAFPEQKQPAEKGKSSK